MVAWPESEPKPNHRDCSTTYRLGALPALQLFLHCRSTVVVALRTLLRLGPLLGFGGTPAWHQGYVPDQLFTRGARFTIRHSGPALGRPTQACRRKEQFSPSRVANGHDDATLFSGACRTPFSETVS